MRRPSHRQPGPTRITMPCRLPPPPAKHYVVPLASPTGETPRRPGLADIPPTAAEPRDRPSFASAGGRVDVGVDPGEQVHQVLGVGLGVVAISARIGCSDARRRPSAPPREVLWLVTRHGSSWNAAWAPTRRAYSSSWRTSSAARGSGGNARVNVDPSGPVRTSAVASLACAMRATMASPSPAPGIPRAAGAR